MFQLGECMLVKIIISILITVLTLFNVQKSNANPDITQTTTKAPREINIMMDISGCTFNELLNMKKQGKSDQEVVDFQMNKDKMNILNTKCFCQLKDKDRLSELKPTKEYLEALLKKCPDAR